ncbi:unnamed protein product [Polarella glacialis]|uniref:UBA domain-containing protein n=1 Tax=Polarella glacialis TaxID=89957 RepID=A0A813JAC2_POLGL|nr:unnamed protein product [Polarella glacialis]
MLSPAAPEGAEEHQEAESSVGQQPAAAEPEALEPQVAEEQQPLAVEEDLPQATPKRRRGPGLPVFSGIGSLYTSMVGQLHAMAELRSPTQGARDLVEKLNDPAACAALIALPPLSQLQIVACGSSREAPELARIRERAARAKRAALIAEEERQCAALIAEEERKLAVQKALEEPAAVPEQEQEQEQRQEQEEQLQQQAQLSRPQTLAPSSQKEAPEEVQAAAILSDTSARRPPKALSCAASKGSATPPKSSGSRGKGGRVQSKVEEPSLEEQTAPLEEQLVEQKADAAEASSSLEAEAPAVARGRRKKAVPAAAEAETATGSSGSSGSSAGGRAAAVSEPAATAAAVEPKRQKGKWEAKLQQLEAMGFADREANLAALQRASGDVAGAVEARSLQRRTSGRSPERSRSRRRQLNRSSTPRRKQDRCRRSRQSRSRRLWLPNSLPRRPCV